MVWCDHRIDLPAVWCRGGNGKPPGLEALGSFYFSYVFLYDANWPAPHHARMIDGSTHRRTLPLRYVWSAERDLMAKRAGMALTARRGSWLGEPFKSQSDSHVSVWRKLEP